jgi:hydrogenase expression/formation protein HypD
MNMKSEFRNAELVKFSLDELHRVIKHQWVLMEICGGQTHAIMQSGLDKLLPDQLVMVHGPGCPVCVTPLELIDKAIIIASQPKVIFTSFGDMLRVPGSNKDLFSVRAAGGEVRVVLSPLDAVQIAKENPDYQVVFFAIGFETTAPANVMSVIKAHQLGLKNYSILVSQVRVPPAMQAILNTPANHIQGFLAAGHVCAVMGYHEYDPIVKKYHVPIVVTGFEPLDLVTGMLKAVLQLENRSAIVENAYSRVVTRDGNITAQKIINEVYQTCDMQWRGIGIIPNSGWCLRHLYSDYDAIKRFNIENVHTHESEICISGFILQGIKNPDNCPAFATICTPENPLGATMVSAEGTCAAYYRYARNQD